MYQNVVLKVPMNTYRHVVLIILHSDNNWHMTLLESAEIDLLTTENYFLCQQRAYLGDLSLPLVRWKFL